MPPPPPRPLGKDVAVKKENLEDTGLSGNIEPSPKRRKSEHVSIGDELRRLLLDFDHACMREEQLKSENVELTQKNAELTQKNVELTEENDRLWQKFERLKKSLL